MTLRPAGPDEGIMFQRTDMEGPASFIPATYDRISDTRLCSVLENGYGVKIGTVEHLMAALWGAGVDNAVIEIDGSEVPIMDGSSEPFITLLEQAGLEEQDAPRRLLVVDQVIEVRDGDAYARIEPHDGFVLDVAIDFAHAAIGAQRAEYDFSDTTFAEALSKARTFGFAEDVERLRAAGLARGGSLENAVVIGAEGVLNTEGLRYHDEFVRHKALDCIGDFFLCGYRLSARVTMVKPGHRVNNLLMRALMARTDAWRLQDDLTSATLSTLTAARGGRSPLARVLHQADK
jgi:UDP-3-O-[3-hydroxymyristoyl] N-acetylglucosamine deacetylase